MLSLMLLFLDIDGTLLPFGAATPYPSYTSRSAPSGAAAAHPLLDRIDSGLGVRLAALGCAWRCEPWTPKPRRS